MAGRKTEQEGRAERPSSGRRLVLFACGFVLLLCAFILGEWISGRFLMAKMGMAFRPMAPNAALLSILLALALLIPRSSLHSSAVRTRRMLSSLAFLGTVAVSGNNLLRSFFGEDMGFHSLLARQPVLFGAFDARRTSPVMLGFLVLLSAGAWLAAETPLPRTRRRAADLLGLTVTGLAGCILIGYLYGSPFLYVGPILPIAFPAAFVALLLAGVLLLDGRDAFGRRLMQSPSVTARIARTVVPGVLLVILAGGWLERYLGSLGMPETIHPLIAAFCALLSIGLITAGTAFIARRIDRDLLRAAAELQAQEQQLRASNQQLLAHEQQLDATNQQLRAHEEKLREQARIARENAARFQSLVRYSPNSIVVYEAVENGEDFVIREFNSAAEESEKLRREDVIGRRVTEVFPNVREFGILEVFQRVWRTNVAEHYPLSQYKDDRITGWRDNYIFKIPSGEIVAVYDDVTAQKQAEEELVFSNLLLTTEQEASIDGILFVDAEDQILSRNKRFNELWNLPADIRDTTQDAPVLQAVVDQVADPDGFLARVRHYYAHRTEKGHEDIPLRDGRVFERYTAPVINDEGRYFGRIWFFRDITARKRTEALLETERNRLRGILDSIPYGVYIVNARHEIEYINPVIEREFGPVNGRKCHAYFHDLDTPCVWCKNADVHAGRNVRWEWYSPKNDRYYDLFDTPLRNPDGSVSKLEIFYDITEQKRAEMRLVESQQHYRRLFEIGNDAIYIHGIDENGLPGKFIDFNDMGCKRLGYSRDELLTMSPLNLDAPDMQPKLPAIMKQLAAQGHLLFEMQHVTRDGRLIPVEINAHVFQHKGQAMVISIARDITERKEAEAALRKKSEELDLYFSSALDLLCIADKQGIFRRLNPAWEHVLGYRLDELEGHSFFEFVHPDDVVATREAVATLDAQKPVLNFANRYRHKDGSYRWLEWRSHPAGETIHSMARNITERKHAEEELRKSEFRYRRLIETANEGVWAMDSDLRTTFVNQQMADMLGYTVSEMIGQPVERFMFPEDLPAHEERMTKRKRGESARYEHRFRRKDGGTLWTLVSASAIRSDDGGFGGSFALFVDITERRENEIALQTLLQSIVGYSGRECLEHITDAVAHWLGADIVVIGEIIPNTERVVSLALYKDGRQEDSLVYDLAGTPCAKTAKRDFCVYPGGVSELFPQDAMLRDQGIESYAGIPIRNRAGHALGILCALSRRTMIVDKRHQDVLKILAARCATEFERQSLENSLRLGEARYHRLFSNMLEGFAVHEILCDDQGQPCDYRFLEVNNAFERLTGLSRDRIVGHTVREVLPSTEAHWIQTYGEVALTGSSIQFESFAASLGRHFQVTAFSPEQGRFATVFTDITQRVAAEEALRRSETLYNTMIDALQDGAHVVDKDLKILHANRAMIETCHHYGTTEEPVGRTVREVFPDLAPDMEDEFKAVFTSGRPSITKERYKARDAMMITDTRRYPVLENGQVVRVVSVVRDITERVLTDQLLQESNERYRAVVDNSPDMVFIVDRDGHCLFANDRMQALFHPAHVDIRGLRQEDLYPPDIAAAQRTVFGRVFATGRPELDQDTSLGQGPGRHFEVTYSPLRGYDGKVNTVLGIARDISDRKRAEASLQQADKLAALGRLAAGVAHELNQPLNAIKNLCQSIVLNIEDRIPVHDARLVSNMNAAVEQVDRMAEIIRNMRIFARQQRDESRGSVDLKAVAHYPAKLLGAQLRVHNIALVISVPDEPCLVMGNEHRLQQILVNLIINARDAIFDRMKDTEGFTGRIEARLAIDAANRQAVIEIADNGAGIPPETIDRIFEPFYTTKDPDKGTGIGLAISYEIIQQHGGSLTASSVPGQGTTFRITLPLLEADPGTGS